MKSQEPVAQMDNELDRIKELERRLVEAEQSLGRSERQLTLAQRQIDAIKASKSWQVTEPLRRVSTRLAKLRNLVRFMRSEDGGPGTLARESHKIYQRRGMQGVHKHLQWIMAGTPGAITRIQYAEWIACYDALSDAERADITQRIATLPDAPLISVVMPIAHPDSQWLQASIESVRTQLYPHWQLCIAVSGACTPQRRHALEQMVDADRRIRIVFADGPDNAAALSNRALALATGEWVAALGQGDLLRELALYRVADLLLCHPETQLIYSDEDQIDAQGLRHHPYFKCEWNPDLQYSQNFFGNLGVYRKTLLDRVGGWHEEFAAEQNYDLVLRCIEQVGTAQIQHIPYVLYQRRSSVAAKISGPMLDKPTVDAGVLALEQHFARRGVECTVTGSELGYRVQYALPDPLPLVSLIIPTRNGLQLVRQCIESIVQRTSYPNYEIIVVDNGSDDPEVLKYFASLSGDARIRVLRDDRPFNYSALNNAAIAQANGTLVGLINNDIEVIAPDWLTDMVRLAVQPEIGAVGAKLLFPNDTLQHGGVVLGIGGIAGHANKYAPQPCYGYFNRTALISAYSAVTAACLIIRKSTYFEVDGLNEVDLTVAYNDVDFCLRVRDHGYRNVWTPYAELYHHESATRGNDDNPIKRARYEAEVRYMLGRWGRELEKDPAYSPNLSMDEENFSLAWPPRVGASA